MAVVAVRSDLLQNTRGNLRQNPSLLEGGIQRSTSAIITITNGDSIGSTYRLMQVPSWHRIRSILAYHGAATNTAINIGLYRTEADGGAVVVANAYADQRAISTNGFLGIQLRLQTSVFDKFTQQVWQDAGYSVDPRIMLDLVVTLSAAAASTNVVAFDVGTVID